jgi:integrase
VTVFRNKQRNNEWRYDFRLGGQRYSGPCLDENCTPVATKKAAVAVEERERVAAREKQKLAKHGIKQGSYTLARACALHLARKEEKTPGHFANHILYVREICAFFGADTAMSDITGEDVEAYRSFAVRQTLRKWTGGPRRKSDDPANDRFWKDTGRPRSKRTVNNYLKCIRALFALAEKVRDPITHEPVVREVPDIALHKIPRRLPTPMEDEELDSRLASAPPWTREAAELSRLFGLRRSEVFKLQRRHISREVRGLRFGINETKSGNEELAHGGEAGWELLKHLDEQALRRGQTHLVTWPGPKRWRAFLRGEPIEMADWQPLKSVRRSWRTTIKAAGIEHPHRFHDVRARYVTEVAKVQAAAAQDAARHQDPATTAMYIKLAASEVQAAVAQAVAQRPIRRKLK